MQRIACYLLLGVSFVLASGCRTPDPTIDLLESELRWMEDNLYHLDHQLDLCHDQLRSAQRNNAALRNELAKALAKATNSKKEGVPASSGVDDKSYDQESKEDLLDLKIPKIELDTPSNGSDTPQADLGDNETEVSVEGSTADNARDKSGVDESATDEAVTAEPNRAAVDLPDDGASDTPMPQIQRDENTPAEPSAQPQSLPSPDENQGRIEDGEVSRIRLNSRLTGAYDDDGQPGPDGILVVIQPQNRQQQDLVAPGEVSIRVDKTAAASPTSPPVAVWNFNSIETAALFQKTLFGRGIYLRLPWPEAESPQGPLWLRVTYESPQGQRFLAHKKIQLDEGSQHPAEVADASPKRPLKLVNWGPRRLRSNATNVQPPQWQPVRPAMYDGTTPP